MNSNGQSQPRKLIAVKFYNHSKDSMNVLGVDKHGDKYQITHSRHELSRKNMLATGHLPMRFFVGEKHMESSKNALTTTGMLLLNIVIPFTR